MKQKLSISVDEETVKLLEKLIKEGRFRNKSHLIEYSVNKYMKGEENE
jgi:Arc/MetJ-type ribon-helix-helix transcriptional regulator